MLISLCVCLECCLCRFGDCVQSCLSLIDASIAEEEPEGGYYQEEGEDYPGHFANQGKPYFDSYPHA
jgi:hypothetical protein